MKLWYVSNEMDEARAETQKLVDSLNSEIPTYINGDVKIKMAWREESVAECGYMPSDSPRMLTYIPEAEVLINGEVAKRDLLELIALDIYALEMKAMRQSGFFKRSGDRTS